MFRSQTVNDIEVHSAKVLREKFHKIHNNDQTTKHIAFFEETNLCTTELTAIGYSRRVSMQPVFLHSCFLPLIRSVTNSGSVPEMWIATADMGQKQGSKPSNFNEFDLR